MKKIIEDLSRSDAWPDPAHEIEVRQTHISVIFLGKKTVFKIKKPVDFGFLDFTTLEKRRHFCEEEVRLNRRLSPDAYLGVVPVTRGKTGLRFGGEGEPVEWAVHMKRLDEQRFLSTLLEKNEVSPSDMVRVAKRIAAFHAEAPTTPEITRIGGKEAILFNTKENFEQIEPHVGKTLDRETFQVIRDYTETFIRANDHQLTEREARGWIRDGHGDLHAQHICLDGKIRIFDCIEFNERFRFGDILNDAAFLVMDLDRLGYPDLSGAFQSAYLEMTQQKDQKALMNFFCCYRAVVRGKVEGFRSLDPDVPENQALEAARSAESFHKLALRYARTLSPPTLILGCGLMGSGKSSAARGLGRFLDLKVLSSDKVRKELAGISPHGPRRVPFGEDIYSPEFTDLTYRELLKRGENSLVKGESVFLDASFMDPARRAAAMELAGKTGARPILVHFQGDEGVLRKRLRQRAAGRSSISDGREEILDQQIRAFKEPKEIPEKSLFTVDTSRGAAETVRAIYARLLSTT
ncbi:MAG: AAA family ATPase [Proteobacteria bacterium]|nr:AAA family ATPase [Pseudomonadota bacterium]